MTVHDGTLTMFACRYCDAWYADESACDWHEARCGSNPNASDDDVAEGVAWNGNDW